MQPLINCMSASQGEEEEGREGAGSQYQWSPSIRLQPLLDLVPPARQVPGSPAGQALAVGRVARHLACQAAQGGLLQASFCIGVVPSACRAGGRFFLALTSTPSHGGCAHPSVPVTAAETPHAPAVLSILRSSRTHQVYGKEQFPRVALHAGWDLVVRPPLTVENMLPMPVEVSPQAPHRRRRAHAVRLFCFPNVKLSDSKIFLRNPTTQLSCTEEYLSAGALTGHWAGACEGWRQC